MITVSVLSAWRMARAAYTQDKALHIAIQEQCDLEHVGSVEEGSAYADLYARDDMVAIAIRGTDDALDILKDMRATPQRMTYGKRHKGVGEDYVDLIRPEIDDWLEENHKGKTVLIIGHSLGGMAANDMAAQLGPFHQVALVVTFGAGRSHYRQAQGTFLAMNTKFLRIENGTDPVVELPHPFPMPYRHPCKAYEVGPPGIARWRILRIFGRLHYHFLNGDESYLEGIKPIEDKDCFSLAVEAG